MLPQPEFIFVPVGSGGTMAGLVLGLMLSGMPSTAVGVRVYSKRMANEKTIAFLANRTLRYLRRIDRSVPTHTTSAHEIVMLHDYYGKGYAHYTEKGVKAVELLRDLEGLRLEGTYSGKAMAAFIDFMSVPARRGKPALFIDTFNSVPLEPLLEGCPGPKILPLEIQEYFNKEIALVGE
jgi:D-cysteine desulfhydrase